MHPNGYDITGARDTQTMEGDTRSTKEREQYVARSSTSFLSHPTNGCETEHVRDVQATRGRTRNRTGNRSKQARLVTYTCFGVSMYKHAGKQDPAHHTP